MATNNTSETITYLPWLEGDWAEKDSQQPFLTFLKGTVEMVMPEGDTWKVDSVKSEKSSTSPEGIITYILTGKAINCDARTVDFSLNIVTLTAVPVSSMNASFTLYNSLTFTATVFKR